MRSRTVFAAHAPLACSAPSLTGSTSAVRIIWCARGTRARISTWCGPDTSSSLRTLSSGRTQITGLRGSGQLVGFAWEGTVYPYTATALTPIIACRIAHRAILQVLQKESAVTLRVLERLAEELAQARTLIRDIGGRNAPFILSLCPPETKMASTLPLPLRRQEMAELLGLSRETVSRVISDLMANGLIVVARGRVSILSPAGLAACVSGTRGDARATLM
jgi:CRP-like cAMP-binding protein